MFDLMFFRTLLMLATCLFTDIDFTHWDNYLFPK